MTKKKLILCIAMLLISVSVFALDCPACGGNLYWTGETKTEWGKILKLERCPAGHQYWVTTQQEAQDNQRGNSGGFGSGHFGNDNDEPNNSYTSGTVTCPLCGGSMYFTGRTKIEWGRMLKIYRCPAGHEAVVK
jgi:Zn-finger nucleic acid-binding protein